MEPSADIEPAFLKMLANIEIATVLKGRKLASSQHSASYNWLLASLLTINGGALVTLSNMDQIGGIEKVLPCLFFYIGLMCAIFCAFFGQLANREAIQMMGEQAGYWTAVEHLEERNSETEQGYEDRAKKIGKKALRARYSGFMSIIAFSIGLAAMGYVLCILPKEKSAAPPVIEQVQKAAK